MRNSFKDAKYAFVDTDINNGYIDIESSLFTLNQLEKAIGEPMQLALLIGNSGVGKTMILKSIHKKLRHQKDIHYIETPCLSENDFLSTLFSILTGNAIHQDDEVSFNNIIKYCNSIKGKREIIVLLDEAQMYSDVIFEQIRLLSDTKVIKFVIVLHKINEKSILSESHFKTRIWSIVELINASKQEMTSYIHLKLINANISNVVSCIGDREFKLIHKYTNGNYRECNKLMFSAFELCELNTSNNMFEDLSKVFSRKIIELSALKLGLANA
jgi:type II secretory pathway predicted ATPase ExeA